MRNFKLLFIAFLVGLTLFSAYKYVTALKEKYVILESLNLEKLKTERLENEKQGLIHELDKQNKLKLELEKKYSLLKGNARAGLLKISQLSVKTAKASKLAEELDSQIAILKAENSAIRLDAEALKEKINQVWQENEDLKLKLVSVTELKKAIGEVKKQARKVAITMIKKTRSQKNIDGNRGFLTKDKKATYPAKVKIEVEPVAAGEINDTANDIDKTAVGKISDDKDNISNVPAEKDITESSLEPAIVDNLGSKNP